MFRISVTRNFPAKPETETETETERFSLRHKKGEPSGSPLKNIDYKST